MVCIICLQEFSHDRPETDEHIFPDSIGGRIIIRRVCKPCNDYLGSSVDNTITDYFPIIVKRQEYQIPNKSGDVPDAFMLLAGQGELVSSPGQKVRLFKDLKSGRYETRIVPRVIKQVGKSSTAIQLVLDARDKELAPSIIKKIASRSGKNIDQGKLVSDLANSTITTIDNPVIKSSPIIKLLDYRMGLLKIAYELGWRWLGDDWLDDQTAVKMRTAIWSGEKEKPLNVQGIVSTPGDDLAGLDVLCIPKSSHFAATFIAQGKAAVLVKVFDCLTAIFEITSDISKYTHLLRCRQGFVIEMDVISRQAKEWEGNGITRFGNWEKILSPSDASRTRQQFELLYPGRKAQ